MRTRHVSCSLSYTRSLEVECLELVSRSYARLILSKFTALIDFMTKSCRIYHVVLSYPVDYSSIFQPSFPSVFQVPTPNPFASAIEGLWPGHFTSSLCLFAVKRGTVALHRRLTSAFSFFI